MSAEDFALDETYTQNRVLHAEENLSLNAGNDFTAEDLVSGETLKQYSIASRLVGYYFRSSGVKSEVMFRPVSEWSLSLFVSFCTVVSALGVSKSSTELLGAADPLEVAEIIKADIVAIKSSLSVLKRKVLTTYTDRTLVEFLVKQQGVMVAEDGTHGTITVPGAPVVKFSLTGNNAGRVISGGKEFVKWHNNAFDTKYKFRTISEDARVHAWFFLAFETPWLDADKNIQFKGVPPLTNNLGRYGYVDVKFVAKGAIGAIKANILRAYSNPTIHTSAGIKADRLTWVEWYLHEAYLTSSDTASPLIKKITDQILKEAATRYKNVLTSITQLPPLAWTVDPGFVIPGTKTQIYSYGKVLEFVTSSRAQIRQTSDVPRKHDAPGIAKLWDGASSVPAKFIPVLEALLPVGKKPVLAYGTHLGNHWQREIEDRYDDVLWHDLDTKYRPVSRHPFMVDNIMNKKDKGWAAGKILLDDTMGEIRDAKATMGRRVDVHRNSGAVGGCIKMYLGADDFHEGRLGSMPQCLLDLREVYAHVQFLPGAGPHSPEFFIVYSAPIALMAGDTSRWVSIDTRKSSGSVVKVDPQADSTLGLAGWTKYGKGWLLYKAMEVTQANVLQNLQVGHACVVGAMGSVQHGDVADSILVYHRPKAIKPNGKEARGAITKDSAVAPPAESDFAL